MALLQISEPGQSPDPHQRRIAVGIDLGTTHSLVASVRNGVAECLPDDDGRVILPSVVRFLPGQGRQIGFDAVQSAASDPVNTIASVKRFMGRGLQDIVDRSKLPYEFTASEQGMLSIQTVQGPKSPVEVSAEILATLPEDKTRLKAAARAAKEALTSADTVSLNVALSTGALSSPISRADFDQATQALTAQQISGVEARIDVKPSYGLSDDQIATMLQESFTTAQADMKARALVEARVDADRMLLATRSALAADGDLLQAPERSAIDALMATLQAAVQTEQDAQALEDCTQALAKGTEAFAAELDVIQNTAMPVIKILPHAEYCPNGAEITAPAGTSICEALLDNHINIEHACDMSAACTTCHVVVREGFKTLNEMEETEEDLLDRAWGLEPNSRLSCQAFVAKSDLSCTERRRTMRQIVLDTETTGLSAEGGDRIIELGCVELYARKLTGNNLHFYFNPERDSHEDALKVHGISNEFLRDKPKFAELTEDILNYLADAELIIHNAAFDIGFLNKELERVGKKPLKAYVSGVIDTLAMAKEMFPGKRNSLDSLCDRLEVDNSGRTLHGALLDAELLADVYINMTRGQEALLMDVGDAISNDAQQVMVQVDLTTFVLPVLPANAQELAAHDEVLTQLDKSSGGKTVWRQMASV
eukprot:gene28863-34835_t